MQNTRLLEALALLPLLHTPPDAALTVGVAGPMSEQLATEALKWREVNKVIGQAPLSGNKRIDIVDKLLPRSLNVLLLSPEQDPAYWAPSLAKDGIICVSTAKTDRIHFLKQQCQSLFGNATPWREYLPQPLFGIIAINGQGKVNRYRDPPSGAKRLSKQYLPCLFTFGKDEIPFILGQR